jgi:hypothetical protein
MVKVGHVGKTVSGYVVACYWHEYTLFGVLWFCSDPKHAYMNALDGWRGSENWRDQDTGEHIPQKVVDALEAYVSYYAFQLSDKTYV